MRKPPSHQQPKGKGGKKKEEKNKKKQYTIRNWREYNQALVNRGKIFFWITDDVIQGWEEKEKTGKRGKPRTFSNSAIETALTLGQVFHMPLRTTEGFLASIIQKLDLAIKSPDYSTLSIRGKTLPIHIRVRAPETEPLHIVADSSGVKVYGEGEWKVRQHGWSKRRTWKKLHIGVDEATGDILLGAVTGNDVADCQMLKPLLDQLPREQPIDQVSTDGAYDKRMCYAALEERHIPHMAIPPQRNAKIWRHGNTKDIPLPRDENLRRIRQIGRRQWKVETRYHRRSLAETAFFRLKTIFGDRVAGRTDAMQAVQLLIRCKALNQMTTLGMPDTVVIV
jgi:hypothetical protein